MAPLSPSFRHCLCLCLSSSLCRRPAHTLLALSPCPLSLAPRHAVPTASPTFAPEPPAQAVPATLSVPIDVVAAQLTVPADETEKVQSLSFDGALRVTIASDRESASLVISTADGATQLAENFTSRDLSAMEGLFTVARVIAALPSSGARHLDLNSLLHTARDSIMIKRVPDLLDAGTAVTPDIGTRLVAPIMRGMLRWDVSNALNVSIASVAVNSMRVDNATQAVVCAFVVQCGAGASCNQLSTELAAPATLAQGTLTGVNGTTLSVAPVTTVARCPDGQYLASCLPASRGGSGGGSSVNLVIVVAVAVGALLLVAVLFVRHRAIRVRRPARDVAGSPPSPTPAGRAMQMEAVSAHRWSEDERRAASAAASARAMHASLDTRQIDVQLPVLDEARTRSHSPSPRGSPVDKENNAYTRTPQDTSPSNRGQPPVQRPISDVRAMYSAAGTGTGTGILASPSPRAGDGSRGALPSAGGGSRAAFGRAPSPVAVGGGSFGRPQSVSPRGGGGGPELALSGHVEAVHAWPLLRPRWRGCSSRRRSRPAPSYSVARRQPCRITARCVPRPDNVMSAALGAKCRRSARSEREHPHRSSVANSSLRSDRDGGSALTGGRPDTEQSHAEPGSTLQTQPAGQCAHPMPRVCPSNQRALVYAPLWYTHLLFFCIQ